MDAILTPQVFKSIRKKLGLSCDQMAKTLRLEGKWCERTVRRYESGDTPISGPITFLMELFNLGMRVEDGNVWFDEE